MPHDFLNLIVGAMLGALGTIGLVAWIRRVNGRKPKTGPRTNQQIETRSPPERSPVPPRVSAARPRVAAPQRTNSTPPAAVEPPKRPAVPASAAPVLPRQKPKPVALLPAPDKPKRTLTND